MAELMNPMQAADYEKKRQQYIDNSKDDSERQFYRWRDTSPITIQDKSFADYSKDERQQMWDSGIRPASDAWDLISDSEENKRYRFIWDGQISDTRSSGSLKPRREWTDDDKREEMDARDYSMAGNPKPLPWKRQDLNQAQALVKSIEYMREEAKKGKENVGYGTGLDVVEGINRRIPFSGGVTSFITGGQFAKDALALYEGKATPAQIMGVARGIVYDEVAAQEPEYVQAFKGVSEMPAFLVEMYATAGIGGAIRKLGEKGGAKLAKELGEKKLKQLMKEAAMDSAIYAGGVGLGKTATAVVEDTQQPLEMPAQGQPTTAGGFAETEATHMAVAVPKAVAKQMGEYFVEKIGGEALGRGVKKFGLSKYYKGGGKASPLPKKFEDKVRVFIEDRVGAAWRAQNPGRTGMLKQAGFDGVLAEWGEERVQEVASAALEGLFSLPPGRGQNIADKVVGELGMTGDAAKEVGTWLGAYEETNEERDARHKQMRIQFMAEAAGIIGLKGTARLVSGTPREVLQLNADPVLAMGEDARYEASVNQLVAAGNTSRSAFDKVEMPDGSGRTLFDVFPRESERKFFIENAEQMRDLTREEIARNEEAEAGARQEEIEVEKQFQLDQQADLPYDVQTEDQRLAQQRSDAEAAFSQLPSNEELAQQEQAQQQQALAGQQIIDAEARIEQAELELSEAAKQGENTAPYQQSVDDAYMGLDALQQPQQPTPEPTPEPTPQPTPDPTPQPAPTQQQQATDQQAVLPQVEQNETQQQETTLQKAVVRNVTSRQIRSAFPGINVKEVDEGFRLDLSTGSVLIRLRETSDISDNNIRQMYGDYVATVDGFQQRFPTAEDYIKDYRARIDSGQFTNVIRTPTKEQAELDILAVIDLNNTDWGRANLDQVKAIKHEMVHFAFNTGMWNKSERDALVKQYSDTKKSFREQSEDIAMSAEVWEDQGMVQRIKNWVNRILSKLTGGKVELSSKAVEQLFKSEDFWQARPAEQMDVFMGQQKNITQGMPVSRINTFEGIDNFSDPHQFTLEGGKLEVVANDWQDTDYSVLSTVVDENKRRQGIATRLVQEMRDTLEGSIGAQVSSENSLNLYWKQGFRMPDGGTKADALAELKDTSSVNLVHPGKQPKADSDIVQGSPYRYANRQGNQAAREAVEDLNEQYDPQRITVQNELDKIEKERASNPKADVELMQRLEDGSSIEARDVLHADQLKDGIFNGGPVSLKQMAEFHKINKLQRKLGTQTAQTLAMFKEVNRNRKTEVQVRLDAITEGMLSVDEATEELLSSIPEKMGEDFVVPDPQQPVPQTPTQPDPTVPTQPDPQQPAPPDPQQPASTDGDMLDPNTPMPDMQLIGREAYQALLRERRRLQKITEFIEKLGYDTTNAGLNRLARDLESSVKVVDFINKTKRHKVRQVADVISEFRYAAMLSGPETQMVNAFSNATFSTWRELEQVMWAAANSTAGIFGQADPQQLQLRDYKQYGAAGITNALGSAFKHAFGAWANEYHGWHKNKLMEDKTGTAFKSKIEMEHTLPGRVRGKIRSVLGFGPMHMVDQFFKTLNAHMHVGVQAAMIARNTKDRGGLSEAELIEDLVANKQSPAWKRAMNEASLRMFQDTGKGASKVLIEAGDKLRTDSAAGFIVRHTVAPFVRTPVRITSQALVRLPGMPMLLPYKIVRNLLDGKPALKGVGSEAVSQVASTIIFALLLGLRNSEDEEDQVLTGAAKGHDSRERTYRYGKGVNPVMAMKLGDEWVSYDRQDPLAIIGATTIDGVDAIKKGDPTILGRSLAGQLHEKTFLRGISDLYTGVTEEKGGKRWAASMIGSFIPKLWGQTTRKFDPYVRDKDVDTIGKQALQRENLIDAPVIYDQWGFPAERSNDIKSVLGMRSKSAERFAGNRVIDNWNRLNPDEKTLTTPPRDTYTPTGKTERKMDRDGQYQEFKKVAGTLAREVVLKAIPDEMARNPSPVVLKITKNALEQARNNVKAHYERNVNFDIDMDRQVRIVLAKVVSSAIKIPKRPIRSNADTDEYALKDTKNWETYKEAVIEYRKWYAQNQSRIRQ